MTNGNRSHPYLFKLGDKAIDLLEKYSGEAASKAF
jgi:hypothetical protein